MYPSADARELAVLLRISRELDIVGDVTATVDNPSELIAWANVLSEPDIIAWRAKDSGRRYLQVTADRATGPIRGRISAVLSAGQHPDFWRALDLADLETGQSKHLTISALSVAWSSMPVHPPGELTSDPSSPGAPG